MNSFDETFDFVVVGSGGGSMCAALVMRGARKSVLVLEKAPLVGGTTAISGGVMWIPNNPFMKRDGVPDSLEAATAYLDAVVGDHNDTPGATRERRHRYLVEGPRMIDFLQAQGIKLTRISNWPDYYDDRPGGSVPGRTVVAELFDVNKLGPWKNKLRPNFLALPATLEEALTLPHMKKSWKAKRNLAKIGLRAIAAKLTGKHYVTAGAALQGAMLHAALESGADIRTDAAVRELIVENGAVAGVVAERDGKTVRIGARLGVLVNAGGFARNQAMRDAHQAGTSADRTSVSEGDTGEMLLEMQRHGAAVAQMDAYIGGQLTIPPGAEAAPVKPGAQGLTAAPHAILVDQSGRRYLNEAGSYTDYCRTMFERDKESPALPSWAIFDSRAIAATMLAGTMPGAKKPQDWFDKGYLKKADTIEQLAETLKITPTTLRATVDRFNGFVAKKHDDEFGRGARAYDRWLGDPFNPHDATLGEIGEGPFYAVPVMPGDVGTLGGVVTDVDGRVLREDGTPIAGLYATGVSTASVMGRTSPGAGVNVGPSVVFGFVSAKHALTQADSPSA
uniref:FAD-binding protein n=1 Tax=uncultured Sphingomonas sp. TaxID=158754 RepID=UPI0035CBE523